MMSRLLIKGMVLAALALAWVSCAPERPAVRGVTFSPGHVVVELSRSMEIRSVAVLEDNGICVARSTFSKGYDKDRIRVDFKWVERHGYRILLSTEKGEIETRAVSPKRPRDTLFGLQFPFGMQSNHTVVPGNTEISGSLQLKNDAPRLRHFDVRISFSEGFRAVDAQDRRYGRTESGTIEFRDRVALANQYDSRIIGIRVRSPETPASGEVSLRVSEKGRILFEQTIRIRVVSPDILFRNIHVADVEFPTDDRGARDQRMMRDVLQLAPMGRLLGLVTGKEQDDADHTMIPYGFYTLTLENQMPEDVAVIVRGWVEDRAGGGSLEAFRPHFHVNAAGEIFSSVMVPGRSVQGVVMPIYVEPASVLPGTYRLCVSLTQFGTDTPFSRGVHAFQVAKQPVVPMAVTMAGALLAAGFVSLVIIFFKRIYGKFKVRWIILAALYGAVGFVGINIPGLFLADLCHALLGPFSFLATGLFFGVIQYMLWGSLITLVPKKGMMTLVMTVRLLLGGVMLGNISAVSLMAVFVHASLTELFLWLAGCTRGKEGATMNPFALAAAFVVSDVMSTCFNFESAIFLYRLYYATWYIS